MNSKNFGFFCGEECIADVDPNPGVMCKTADRGKEQRWKTEEIIQSSYREVILADKVRGRIHGAVSDLHAADAR